MKLTLPRDMLVKALGHVDRIVEKRNTIPILSHARLTAREGALTIIGTDLDIEARAATAAVIATPGEACAPASALHDIARKLPSGSEVSLETDAGQLVIRAGRARFRLGTLPVSDFPDLPAGPLTHAFDIEARKLGEMIARTAFAISSEETRYYLNGIFLHVAKDASSAGDMLRFVATDGHRLARLQMLPPKGCEDMPGVILPRKLVTLMGNLAREAKEIVQLQVSAQKVRLAAALDFGSLVIVSKLIDGTFPDYNRVIPQEASIKATLDRAGLAAAVDRVATISSERGRAVKCELSDTGLTLSVTNPDAGESREEIESEHEGDPVTIGFNARYMLDMLSAMEADTVIAGFTDAGSPATFRATTDGSALYVLMPMRV